MYLNATATRFCQIALVVGILFLPLGAAASDNWAQNSSSVTTCAEEDNINIPLHLPAIERFTIIATHPAYCPCLYDGCPADFSGCSSSPNSTSRAEICEKIWDDGVNVVEVCTLSDWWRPLQMEVEVNGQSSHTGHYLRLYRKIADQSAWPQVLVLYEDGYLRIKPHPPEGIQDICFGSSVVIGPVVVGDRPYADVTSVQIWVDQSSISLDLLHPLCGGWASTHIDFSVDRGQAVANVTGDFLEVPAVFRSMWVEDGNCDVDHIQTAHGNNPILSSWDRLDGTWWFFHREEWSQHNTSGPDIRIVANTASAFRVDAWGNSYADGSYYGQAFLSGSADVAEWVPVSGPVEPGDVLELDPDNPGQYRKARGPCSTLVGGVVSTKPGFVLGSRLATEDSGLATPDRALLALLGIVPVKVTDEGGPIQPGDLLVTSSTPGYAMRWDPESGSPCSLVGKALETYTAESGIIRVLLMAH